MSFICTYGGPVLADLVYHRRGLSERGVLLKRHVPAWQDAGVGGIVVPVDSLDELAVLVTEIAEAAPAVQLARTVADVERVIAGGAIAVMVGITFTSLSGVRDVLPLYSLVGTRTFLLAGNTRNLLIDGCGERNAGGLSHFGVATLQELDRLGILVDVSHTSERGFWEVADAVKGPFMASHSNAAKLTPNPRNLSDDQLREIARHRGIIGLSSYPTLVSSTPDPTIEHYLDHVDYVRSLVGSDHIAIGADFIDLPFDLVHPGVRRSDPTQAIYGDRYQPVRGLEGIGGLRLVREGLIRRSYPDGEVAAILGGNLLRVLRELEERWAA